MTETRVTSPTGGSKGVKLAQLGALDPRALLAVAEVAGYGADKYTTDDEPGRFNYLKGYNWGLSFDALQRHLLAFWSGEDLDPESGLSHLAHACWHTLALTSFWMDHPGYDDRPEVGAAVKRNEPPFMSNEWWDAHHKDKGYTS